MLHRLTITSVARVSCGDGARTCRRCRCIGRCCCSLMFQFGTRFRSAASSVVNSSAGTHLAILIQISFSSSICREWLAPGSSHHLQHTLACTGKHIVPQC
eukprot:3131796-Rhodomonas_salina.1